MNAKNIVALILLTLLAFVVQLFPTYTSEKFIFVTALSALPIALATAIKPRFGLISVLLSFIFIYIFNMHEATLFACTNAVVGLSIGVCHSNAKDKIFTALLGGLLLTAGVSVLIIWLGFTPLGPEVTDVFSKEMLGFLTFAIVYTYIYNFLFKYVFDRTQKYLV